MMDNCVPDYMTCDMLLPKLLPTGTTTGGKILRRNYSDSRSSEDIITTEGKKIKGLGGVGITLLARDVNVEQKTWDLAVRYVPYNTARQDTTGFTPFFLTFGREARNNTGCHVPRAIEYTAPDFEPD
ncbi:hypothetical protein TNIN_293661 [Trichonephila inaurata madagascariensis]|uniref:Uncharacterized protein n=1 Tax=Trichonephila inaurata madagascariensis TaxID=2747483 RepID=A0A8X6KEL2_9ARAC|nr:hypothetical protein TNIN_293661 [Trichonephila inaurata madagascariensis]